MIPHDDPLKHEPAPSGYPARGIHAEKRVEGEAVNVHGLGEHTGNPSDIGAAPIEHGHVKHNRAATSDPGVTDDISAGYSTGSIWINVLTPAIFQCVTAAAGAADWNQTDVSKAVVATDDVSSPPTDAELDTAFGDSATLGAGFTGLLDDNDAGTAVWLCYVVAGAWWYEALTKAV